MQTLTDRKLLVLVMKPGRQDFEDLHEIGKEVLRQASDIFVHIVTPFDTSDAVPAAKWQLPALTVGLGPLGSFTPPRGQVLSSMAVKKLDQYARFKACGIDTPHTERFEFGHSYDEKEWGEFCILKPLPLSNTSKGNLQLIRTRRLGAIRLGDYPADHFLRKGPALVQRFINTGKKPNFNRVMTLFGRPLMWWRNSVPIERPDFAAPDSEIERAVIDTKNPEVKRQFPLLSRLTTEIDDEVFAFAARMHEAFPSIALKGCDVLREEGTGRLFAIEINGGGNVWHFSSNLYEKQREIRGGRDALVKLYDPWPKAAGVLIEKTRELAS